MAKVINIQFRRPRLPRRLLRDGWWLQSLPVRPAIIAFPKRNPPKVKTRPSHLTLIHPGK